MIAVPNLNNLGAIANMSDQEVLARVAWGEARGLGPVGMQATLNTVNNRLKSGRTWWGSTLRGIALAHYQYSCLNPTDPNLPQLLSVTDSDPQLSAALGLAGHLLVDCLPDVTNGADSYFDRRLPRWPVWYLGLQPCFTLGPHLYFNTVSRSLSTQAAASTPPPSTLGTSSGQDHLSSQSARPETDESC